MADERACVPVRSEAQMPSPVALGTVELGEHAAQVRVEQRGIGLADVVSGPPPGFAELAGVGHQRLAHATTENKPQTDVGVPARRRCRLGDGHEQRVFAGDRGEDSLDAKLFPDFTPHGRNGVLTRLNVAAGGKPQPGFDMVDE